SDFVIGLASGSGKLRGLRRPEAVAALPQAGPSGSGLLVTSFAGVKGTPGRSSSSKSGWESARLPQPPRLVEGGPCALVRLRSSRDGVGARLDGWIPRTPSRGLAAGVVELGSGGGTSGVGAYIVSVVGHPYLATLLPLWLTMSSYPSTTPVVLALVRNTKRQGKSFCWGSWNHIVLAVDGEHLVGAVPIGVDRPVDEMEEDFLELLAIAPFMNLCSERLRAVAYETPQGVVFSRHHIVFFAEPEGWAVITLAVSQISINTYSQMKQGVTNHEGIPRHRRNKPLKDVGDAQPIDHPVIAVAVDDGLVEVEHHHNARHGRS
ncbi:hypothetical protein GW17_00010460, partial [Ensete ventricosum]